MDDQLDLGPQLAKLQEFDGVRLELFDRLGLPQGWVVNSQVPPGFWDKCKTYAIPLKAKKLWGIFPSRATLQYASLVMRYGRTFMMVLIQDEESEGYSGGPLFLADLDRDPYVLLDESLSMIGKDDCIVEAKRHAAMVLLGWVDTK